MLTVFFGCCVLMDISSHRALNQPWTEEWQKILAWCQRFWIAVEPLAFCFGFLCRFEETSASGSSGDAVVPQTGGGGAWWAMPPGVDGHQVIQVPMKRTVVPLEKTLDGNDGGWSCWTFNGSGWSFLSYHIMVVVHIDSSIRINHEL